MSAEGWQVRDNGKDDPSIRDVDNRSEAEETKADMVALGATPEQIEITPPVEGDDPAPDGGETVEPEVVDHSEEDDSEDETQSMEQAAPMPSEGSSLPVDGTTDGEDTTELEDGDSAGYSLPERSVSDDPMQWVPGEFVDQIDGSQAINRKGFAVLAHFYKIETSSEVITSPEDTDFEFCRVKAVATTKDGREYEAHGSAHTDRDDDPWLLLEMADTRAKKRALADATGVGAVAVAELKNEVGA